MRAVILRQCGEIEQSPLISAELPTPEPGPGQVLVKVIACGLCHTDLDEIEGRLAPSRLPIVLGHQIVGKVAANGPGADRFKQGDRVGITWLNSACGKCRFCAGGRENLCDQAKWTGKDVDGGYAEYTVVDQRCAHPIPENFSDLQAAPLLCAGVIGYRAMRLCPITADSPVALFGFGASAHIVIQLLKHRYPRTPVYVFTRGLHHRQLARKLGADWTGLPTDAPPKPPAAAIDFTPVGQTVRTALEVLDKGGTLVINAIRKTTPVPELDYTDHLWLERRIQSVANVTARDAEEFLPLAAQIPITSTCRAFPLEKANEALLLLKQAKLEAAAAIVFD